MHSVNLVHRDIKLDNILVHEENEKILFKFGDFGFSKNLMDGE